MVRKLTENIEQLPMRKTTYRAFYKSSRSRANLYKRLSIVLLAILGAVTASSFFSIETNESLMRVIWFMTGATGLLIIWLLKQTMQLDWLMPPVVYAFIFWAFHFGLLFPASISLSVLDTMNPWTKAWIDQPDTISALLAALLFLISFAVGVLLFYRDNQAMAKLTDSDKSPELIRVGWALIGIGLLFILAAVINLGWRIFLGGYQSFYSVHNFFSWPIIIMATGFIIQIAGGQERQAILRSLLFLFTPVIVPVLIGGARTAPLFSMAAILSMLGMRGFRLPLKLLIPATVLLLIITATVKDIRQQGMENLFNQGTGIEAQDPLSGLTELGGSLRPVSASLDYIRKRGDFFYGETYIFPLTRQIERFTGTRGTVLTDERFIAARVNQLYGSIGFSTAAEAYVNFGILGIILFAFGWGAILGWLTGWATTPYRLALLAVLLIPMFINVRNSFIYVPTWIVLGLLPLTVAYLLRNSIRKVTVP
jgi:oligosaccharide repeat unit polymerase